MDLAPHHLLFRSQSMLSLPYSLASECSLSSSKQGSLIPPVSFNLPPFFTPSYVIIIMSWYTFTKIWSGSHPSISLVYCLTLNGTEHMNSATLICNFSDLDVKVPSLVASVVT